jgi:mannose-6-phosphate isomerase
VALRPVRFEPLFVRRIWGARSLAPLFPEKQSLGEPVGEVWLTANECRFADQPFAGEKLGDVWPRMNDEWAGKGARHDRPFPVLVKFLFPEDKLSVQVHPHDDYAMRHEPAAGGVGKTEMWYVISARPGAEVRVGLKSEVNDQTFRSAIAAGNAEEMLERIPVNAGDAIFVPAGTVHTIGPGMVLCEVQQNSDVTYRVYDFGRVDAQGKPRDLHIEKAFAVIRFGKQYGGRVSQNQHAREAEAITLAECAYFSVTKSAFANSRRVPCQGQMKIVVVLEGRGTLRTEPGSERTEYARAQAWLVPAALRDCFYEPRERTTLLSVSFPGQN